MIGRATARRWRYRLWWAWAKFRLGSDLLLAAGHRPPKDGGGRDIAP